MSVVAGTHTRRVLYGDLHRYFHRRMDSHVDADDLTQDTWLATDRFRGECSLRYYLFSVARRRLADWHRQRGKWGPFVSELDELLPLNPSTSFGSRLDCVRAAHSLRKAIEALDEPYRSVMQLSAQGLSGPEISEILGVPCNTVRSRRARGRAKLAAMIRDDT